MVFKKSVRKVIDVENEFLVELLGFQYGEENVARLRELSGKVAWARGWPQDDRAFWNAEAFMWRHKIEKKMREMISEELAGLEGGRNLDIGCGAFSYVRSVGFDMSEKMLQFNERCVERVQGDLGERLLFVEGEFDSVTAVFVLNYVTKIRELLQEIWRVLKQGGMFVVVLSGRGVNGWQGQKEVNRFSFLQWGEMLESAGFEVERYEKEGLWFLKGKKRL